MRCPPKSNLRGRHRKRRGNRVNIRKCEFSAKHERGARKKAEKGGWAWSALHSLPVLCSRLAPTNSPTPSSFCACHAGYPKSHLFQSCTVVDGICPPHVRAPSVLIWEGQRGMGGPSVHYLTTPAVNVSCNPLSTFLLQLNAHNYATIVDNAIFSPLSLLYER